VSAPFATSRTLLGDRNDGASSDAGMTGRRPPPALALAGGASRPTAGAIIETWVYAICSRAAASDASPAAFVPFVFASRRSSRACSSFVSARVMSSRA
jgi:hypothetical protein